MVYFEIQANDTIRAVHFYHEVFNWNFEEAKGLPVEYWRIESIEGWGGLLKRPAETPPPQCGTNAFVCSFQVKNFDDTAQKILKLGGQIALPKFAVPGKCWQGYFIDTEGNTFGTYEVDDRAK
jgi:uncharacterized protein